MKILIIGNGGREHAIAWKLEQNERVEKIYCSKGNAASKMLKKTENIVLNSISEYIEFAKNNTIDLTIVGSEELLVQGIVDEFKENGLKIFGPDKKAAELEGSKVFSKEFMKKYGVKTAKHENFYNSEDAMDYLSNLVIEYPIVIKADGLAAGKGVIIAFNLKEAISAVEEIMVSKKFNEAGNKIVIEEYLDGKEVSVLSFTDSNVIVPFISAKDHKKIGVGETGLNTGGMGVISPNPYYTEDVEKKFYKDILEPTLEGIKAEKMDFEGVIFFGLMITSKGVYLLEYNMRLGDPETQAVLPLLKDDLLSLIEITLNKKLGENVNIAWKQMASCCVVASAGGYPEAYKTGDVITGLESLIANRKSEIDDKSLVFICGANEDVDGSIKTNGGRILNVVGLGETLEEAQKKAYEEMAKIQFNGKYFRNDIGN
jgi:phosphoribosylamine--glycine ligase